MIMRPTPHFVVDNDIFTELITRDLNGEELSIMFYLIRAAEHREPDLIRECKLQDELGITDDQSTDAIGRLINCSMIELGAFVDNTHGERYLNFNDDFEDWTALDRRAIRRTKDAEEEEAETAQILMARSVVAVAARRVTDAGSAA
jgi:hypothetical protein